MTLSAPVFWEHMGQAAAGAICVFVLIGLALRLRDTTGPRLHIQAMIGFFAVALLDVVDSFAYDGVFSGPDALYQWQDITFPGYLVALYLFIRGLTSARATFKRRDLLHLLPFAIAFVCTLPSLMLPGALRKGALDGAVLPAHQLVIEATETAYWLFWIAFLVIYGTLGIRRLVRHKRNIRALFSDLSGKTLGWLDALIATICAVGVITILDDVGELMGFDAIRSGAIYLIFNVGLTGAFGLFALRATPPLPDWSEDVLTPEPAVTTVVPDAQPVQAAASRYARSGLHDGDLERYATRLEQRMKDGQLWRDHGLNLRRLASEIAIPAIHLSEVLNTKLGQSFYDYINQARVQDACDLLHSSEMNVLEIAETVGFNAKSTFNTAFKKVTGKTPSQWRSQGK